MYTIIDIETTGNGIKGNKITEIAIFKYDGVQVVDEFTSLVNPECPIPYFITGLTGIDDQMVASAPTFQEIAPTVYDMTKDSIFVAHSVNFDYGVIKEEFRQIGTDFVRKKLCTVRLSRKLIPGLRSYSLGKLCTALGIAISDRHRAGGDAAATVTLFNHLLGKPDAETTVAKFLNARSQEATLPPNLDRKIVDNIPHAPGIYYFKNSTGTIIYVGKAINLKKRVLGHFYDKSNKEIRMCREVTDIDFELSGSELIALLMEAAAIKKHFPKFNSAQKRITKQYVIFSYEDRRGIVRLGYTHAKQIQNQLAVLYAVGECRSFLHDLCIKFELCPKFCQLLDSTSDCRNYAGSQCDGICSTVGTIEAYNEKVRQAIDSLKADNDTLILKQKGRTQTESAFILIENGTYLGYGFIDDYLEINSNNDIRPHLIPQKDTLETQQILRKSIQKAKLALTLG
ncbi:MAG: DNA polymerase III subunit epsilon [Allomuricauda sp.]|nr:MAG: DNA polymerase III subunit epsilon [Allomuricauda sp.]